MSMYGDARTDFALAVVNIAVTLVAALPRTAALADHAEHEGGLPWHHIAFDAFMMVATSIFVTVGASHLAATWILRKDFDVAIR